MFVKVMVAIRCDRSTLSFVVRCLPVKVVASTHDIARIERHRYAVVPRAPPIVDVGEPALLSDLR
jgi:hypothetical protein